MLSRNDSKFKKAVEKAKATRQINAANTIKAMRTSDQQSKADLCIQLMKYVPEYNKFIIAQLGPIFISDILNPKSYPEYIDNIIELICKMLHRAGNNKEYDPISPLMLLNGINEAIVEIMRKGTSNSLTVITGFIVDQRDNLISYFLAHEEAIDALIQCGKIGTEESGMIISQFLTFGPRIIDLFIQKIGKDILLLDTDTTLRLITSHKQSILLKEAEIRQYLLNLKEIPADHLGKVFQQYPAIWNSLDSFTILLHATNATSVTCGWLSSVTVQNIEMTPEQEATLISQVLSVDVKATGINSFVFIRLYLLTLLRTQSITPELQQKVMDLAFATDQNAGFAALQVCVDFARRDALNQTTLFVLMLAAQAFSQSRKNYYRAICCLLLCLLVNKNNAATVLVQQNAELLFSQKQVEILNRGDVKFATREPYRETIPETYEDNSICVNYVAHILGEIDPSLRSS